MLASPAHSQTDDEIMEAINAVSFYVVAANACRDENGGSERFGVIARNWTTRSSSAERMASNRL